MSHCQKAANSKLLGLDIKVTVIYSLFKVKGCVMQTGQILQATLSLLGIEDLSPCHLRFLLLIFSDFRYSKL